MNYTIHEWVLNNLQDMVQRRQDIVIDENNPILQYTQLMEDATPYDCEYGTELEASVFALIYETNVAIYTPHNETTTNDRYDLLTRIFVNDDAPTTCLLYCNNKSHYKLMDKALNVKPAAVKLDERTAPIEIDTNALPAKEMNAKLAAEMSDAKLAAEMPDAKLAAAEKREKDRIRKRKSRAREKEREHIYGIRANEKARKQQSRVPIGRRCNIDTFDPTSVEPFDCGSYGAVMCDHCHALGYEAENKSKKKEKVHFGKLCCNQGKIDLDHLPWLHRPDKYNNKTSSDIKEYHAIRARSRLTKKQLKALEAWETLTDGQREAAEELYQLFYNNTKEARYFRNNLRKFNAAMSMASLQVTDATLKKGGAAAFKVCGMLYRRVGPMLPSLLPDLHATCTQIYFLDEDYQAELRASRFKDAKQRHSIYQYDLAMFKKLHQILKGCQNSYLKSFLSAREYVEQHHLNPDNIEFEIHPLEPPREIYRGQLPHPGRFNLPSVPEISILLPNEDHPGAERSVVCQMRQPSTTNEEQSLKFVSEGHRSYEPLQYELLRPFGTDGWNYNTMSGKHKVSIPEYTRYHMMERKGEESMLHRSKKLFQQYITDQYARAESRSLGYLKSQAMQTKLRRDSRYNVMSSILRGQGAVEQSGRQTIFPSSHAGSDRWYYKKFQDVMAIVGKHGKPHLWITNTMNVNSKDVKDQLRAGETVYDRPELLVRLFRIKNDAMLDDIIKDQIFGKVVAYVTVIEFQKRGAPHSHTLIWLEDFDMTVKNIDNMISAEIPPEDSPLHPLVQEFMLHRCGQWCQQDGACKDHFPFDFLNETFIAEDAYPQYRRRSPMSGGHTCSKRYERKQTTVTNQNVVPYSPYLLMKYQCHINVEMCHSIKAIKYLCFYPLKGEDLMDIKVDMPNKQDEIGCYEKRRYISACSAALSLIEIPRVKIQPPVEQLPIHLEKEESIVYKPNIKSAIDAVATQQIISPLTAYFHRNKSFPNEAAKKYKYEDFPEHYLYQIDEKLKEKTWQKRTYEKEVKTLGRMISIHPNAGELFYLRLLLKNKGGVTSFADLLTVDDHQYETPKEACIAMELLQDDAQWIACMNEAAQFKVGTYPLRDLFCTIVYNCQPTDPKALFELFRREMSEDFLWKRRSMSKEDKEKYADNDLLLALNDFFVQHDKCSSDYGIPMPDKNLHLDVINNEEEYDPNAEEYFNEKYPLLNDEQREAFDYIQQCIDNNEPCFVHIDSPAGSGKTFLGNLILAYIRKHQRFAIGTAMTGIAAILLTLGTTSHKRFRFPIPCMEGSTSNLTFDSKQAKIIKEAEVIIIDEVSCMTRWLLECLDRFLRELMDNDEVMGGKRVILTGDFRQALPVVKHGSRAKIISESVKSSRLWRFVKTIRLKRNMRVEKLIHPDSAPQRKQELEEYVTKLLAIGDGTFPTVGDSDSNIIEIPPNMVCSDKMNLEGRVYNNFTENNNFKNPEYLRGRAILSPTNDVIQDANVNMVKQLKGDIQWVDSVDACVEDEQKKMFDASQLNKIEASGIPPHRLPLKKDACIILIRNLNLRHRHVNGTRCIIEDIKPHVIKARLLDGGKYPEIFIPKIPIVCSETDFPAKFTRTQFPILLAYYLTFNRAQGQSLERVGMLLNRSVFTHGLLYIGMSRSGDPVFVSIYADQNEFQHLIDQGILDPSKKYTRNIVYPEILE